VQCGYLLLRRGVRERREGEERGGRGNGGEGGVREGREEEGEQGGEREGGMEGDGKEERGEGRGPPIRHSGYVTVWRGIGLALKPTGTCTNEHLITFTCLPSSKDHIHVFL